ncbi:hypothetical protein HPB47_022147 [Ixodes persulcatus]|uniref:Uncharacterized protein n=1 Tax=Ixodes persulcatus TaxID=34615 RepID=A0AC60QAH5_IXOPE|nr:hypothetical protein HPB47_022147 [Ixodes persulcatus]
MRGVKSEIFGGLVCSPPTTVDGFVAEATNIVRALSARAVHYQRLAGVSTVQAVSPPRSDVEGVGIEHLRQIIRDLVRDELRKLLPASNRPASLSIAEVVREEVQRARQPDTPIIVPAPEEPALSYATMARRHTPVAPQPRLAFTPNATMHVAHHILIYGCGEPGYREWDTPRAVWECGEMSGSHDMYRTGPTCNSASHIIYAWARDAPALVLPKGVGFKIGGNSGIQFLVNMEVACRMEEKLTLYPFAFRTHTHMLGNDEMCNFYMMYYVEGDSILEGDACFSYGPPEYSWRTDPMMRKLINNKIDKDASELD